MHNHVTMDKEGDTDYHYDSSLYGAAKSALDCTQTGHQAVTSEPYVTVGTGSGLGGTST